MNGALPAGMPTSTLNIWAPPIPARFIASRSAVMPSLELLPLHQCHHVWGWAECGGLAKLFARSSGAATAALPAAAPITARMAAVLAFILIAPLRIGLLPSLVGLPNGISTSGADGSAPSN